MDTPAVTSAPSTVDYERDFHAWCMEQAAALRGRARPGVNDGLDYANLAEEIECLGRSQRSAIRSQLRIILLHLLKWRHQPQKRSDGWTTSMANGRNAIEVEIEDSPSLARFPGEVLESAYTKAVREAERETGIPTRNFPAKCPFTIEQVLDFDFLPPDADESSAGC
jgi:hypothetical protein